MGKNSREAQQAIDADLRDLADLDSVPDYWDAETDYPDGEQPA